MTTRRWTILGAVAVLAVLVVVTYVGLGLLLEHTTVPVR
jgi:hypothetical protein